MPLGQTQSGVSTITSEKRLPPWLEGALQGATNSASGYYQGFQQNPSTLAGLQNMSSLAANIGDSPGYRSTMNNFAGLMGGNFLTGGQGFQEAMNAAANDITPRVQSAFNSGGRLNSGLAQTALASELGDSFAGLYNAERNRQMQGLSMAPQMMDLAFSPAERQYRAGKLAQAENEDNLDDYIRRLTGIGGVAGGSMSETSPLFSNPLAEGLGLGLTGLGIIDGLFGGGGGGLGGGGGGGGLLGGLGGLFGGGGDVLGELFGGDGGSFGVNTGSANVSAPGAGGEFGLSLPPGTSGLGQDVMGGLSSSGLPALGTALADIAGTGFGIGGGLFGSALGSGGGAATTLGATGSGFAGLTPNLAGAGLGQSLGSFSPLAGSTGTPVGMAAGETVGGLSGSLGNLGSLWSTAAPLAIAAPTAMAILGEILGLTANPNQVFIDASERMLPTALSGDPIDINGQTVQLASPADGVSPASLQGEYMIQGDPSSMVTFDPNTGAPKVVNVWETNTGGNLINQAQAAGISTQDLFNQVGAADVTSGTIPQSILDQIAAAQRQQSLEDAP